MDRVDSKRAETRQIPHARRSIFAAGHEVFRIATKVNTGQALDVPPKNCICRRQDFWRCAISRSQYGIDVPGLCGPIVAYRRDPFSIMAKNGAGDSIRVTAQPYGRSGRQRFPIRGCLFPKIRVFLAASNDVVSVIAEGNAGNWPLVAAEGLQILAPLSIPHSGGAVFACGENESVVRTKCDGFDLVQVTDEWSKLITTTKFPDACSRSIINDQELAIRTEQWDW